MSTADFVNSDSTKSWLVLGSSAFQYATNCLADAVLVVGYERSTSTAVSAEWIEQMKSG